MENVLVTVGTTRFDKLVAAVLSEPVIDCLINKGCKKLIIQKGNSNIQSIISTKLIDVNIYSFKDSIIEDINNAHLVIGHCGAGTILDVLRSKKPLLVVINQDLMDNHQTELAQELSKQNYLESCVIDNLTSSINTFDKSKLKTLPEPSPNHFIRFLDDLVFNE